MRWSKLRTVARERWEPGVRPRVDLFLTGYRTVEVWRWAVLIDGGEIAGMDDVAYWKLEGPLMAEGRSQQEVRLLLQREGRHKPEHFRASVEAFQSLTVERALATDDAVLRALAILDRRLGRRRLPGVEPLSPLESACLDLRSALLGSRAPDGGHREDAGPRPPEG